jgi:hypothetical protein
MTGDSNVEWSRQALIKAVVVFVALLSGLPRASSEHSQSRASLQPRLPRLLLHRQQA